MMSIYVETLIRAPMELLWRHTQAPPLHERWDLRFSRIVYLPRERASDRQRFHYSTRIGFGLEVSGDGETMGQRQLPDGSAVSSLRFSSADPISIIREGSGYWKYVPVAGGIQFFTAYDYRIRFGVIGAVVDRLVFRPLLGWATAWSFDRLRLWLEARLDPAEALRRAVVHAVARIALAAIFIYQAVVPKLLHGHTDEIALLARAGVPSHGLDVALLALGGLEVALAAAMVLAWCRRWPVWLCLAAMALATGVVAWTAPDLFTAAFNPFALNLAVAALAVVDLLVVDGVPSARRCSRRPGGIA